jgi:dATP pyrophosphohydrolase
MVRAPFQILVLPYRKTGNGGFEFAVFCRSDEPYWQGIAGGGEDDETPLDAAKRESFEEAGISPDAPYLPLDTTASISVRWFRDSHLWGEDRFVIPEHAFGVDCGNRQLVRSHEHSAVHWLRFAAAYDLFRYDSNRTALWELHQRIRGLGPRDEAP